MKYLFILYMINQYIAYLFLKPSFVCVFRRFIVDDDVSAVEEV